MRKVCQVQPGLVDIFRRSGDANIGQTLIRLAKLAEATHRYDAADRIIKRYREDHARIEGLNPRPAVLQCPPLDAKRTDRAHKEVGP